MKTSPFKTGRLYLLAFIFASVVFPIASAETLPPLKNGKAPQSFGEMWSGFDPRAEPLDVEVLHEWEENDVVMQVLRYRIGIFKGQKSMMAAIYGFPKGGKDLPGLLNIHGGGQYADYKAVLTNAKRGYATITIAWAGRLSSPDYRVSPNEVALFWEGKTDDPKYRITTDWGALDAYHAPSKHGKDAFPTIPDGNQDWTLDEVESPRNNSWFLVTLGARRALTFLEQRPEVDGEKLGVYGHSMGGKLTVATAASDERVKAAAPSCGGISDRYSENPLHRNTVGDATALKEIDCPTIFLSPANDFHGHINNLVEATQEIQTKDWRVVASPHLNHRDSPEGEVASQLWFDQYLKGSFSWPETPGAELQLKKETGIPVFTVKPDQSRPVLKVEVFYTQQGFDDGDRAHRENRINRFWHSAEATQAGDTWTAALPVFSPDLPLWVYANVLYPLDEPVTGAGYYYGVYTTEQFRLSTLIQKVSPGELREAGVTAVLKPTPVIETFDPGWEKQWFTHKSDTWEIRTHKVYHPLWAAPEGARLSLEVRSPGAGKFVVGIDGYATEVILNGGTGWQTILLPLSDFTDASGAPLDGWSGIKELRLLPEDRLRSVTKGAAPRLLGGAWEGEAPEFRSLRWIGP
ncbi:MAG: acetylxylan esterase [Verrucomicrobiales bacterium]|nr:acetylxylan esterase [Verrucomicrobiales bacterium]